MPREHAGRLPRGHVPEPHRAVSTPRGQQSARRVEDRPDVPGPVAGGCGEDLAGFAGGQIPEGDRVAAGHGGELAAAGVPGHRTDDLGLRMTVVVSQQGGLPAGGHIPEPHRAVPGRGGRLRAVGAEGHVVDEALVPAEDPVPLGQLHVPDARLAVGRARHQQGAVRGERRAQTSCLWPRSTAISSPDVASQSRSV